MSAREKFTRSGVKVRSSTFSLKDNTIELIWTTGAPVRRYDYYDGTEYDEVLSLEPGAVDLTRLNAGAPLLDTHDSSGLSSVIGSVVPGSASIIAGKGVATVKLSGAAAHADVVGNIAAGVIRNVSVGYWCNDFIESEGEDGTTVRLITSWTPLEISAVPIPADAGSQFRSAADPKLAARQIRTIAKRAGLVALGEAHIQRGGSVKAFFDAVKTRGARRKTQAEAGAAMARAAASPPTRTIGADERAGAAMARKALAPVAPSVRRDAESVGHTAAAAGGGRTAEQVAAIDYVIGRRAAQALLGRS